MDVWWLQWDWLSRSRNLKNETRHNAGLADAGTHLETCTTLKPASLTRGPSTSRLSCATFHRVRSIPVILMTTQGPVPLTLQVAANPLDWETGYRGKPEPANDHEGILFFFPKDTLAPFNMLGVPFDLELHAGGSSGYVTGGAHMKANAPGIVATA